MGYEPNQPLQQECCHFELIRIETRQKPKCPKVIQLQVCTILKQGNNGAESSSEIIRTAFSLSKGEYHLGFYKTDSLYPKQWGQNASEHYLECKHSFCSSNLGFFFFFFL
jgi:hypothetical protein